MNISYGYGDKYIDVTDITFSQCYINGLINIPKDDVNRATIFGDPCYGIKKNIKIVVDGKETIYDDTVDIILETPQKGSVSKTRKYLDLGNLAPIDKLRLIHSNVKFVGGNIRDEYPEQLMAAEFIKPDSKVLELGSNIGRNTMTIASILKDETQFVTLECNAETCKMLDNNRKLNGFNFHIEPSALSRKKLYLRGWDCFTEENKPSDAVEINTITWENLNEKYGIQFDIIVADCEGAMYNIFIDFPNILDNIHTVIMENDYHVLEHKQYVDKILYRNGFDIKQQSCGGWGCCKDFFYQVWTK